MHQRLQKQQKVSIVIATILAVSLQITALGKAQEEPTPAPSKTATPSPAQTETIATENTTSSRTFTEPLTQKDLNVLTGNVQRPNGISWLDGRLYVVCNGDWTLYNIDDTNGETQTFIFGIKNAHSIVTEETTNGFNLWVPDFENNTLFRVGHTRTAPTPIANNLSGPWGIAPIGDDAFVVTNLIAENIVTITKQGDVRELVSGLRKPTGIATNERTIFVANNGSARRAIEWFSLDETNPTPKPLISGLQNTTNLVYATDGFLYFAYSLGNRGVVGRILPENCMDDSCTNEDIEIVLYTELPAPLAGLTVTPDLRLYVHTIYRPEIYWVSLN